MSDTTDDMESGLARMWCIDCDCHWEDCDCKYDVEDDNEE